MYPPLRLWPGDYYCPKISYLNSLFTRVEGALNSRQNRIFLFYYTLNYLKSTKSGAFIFELTSRLSRPKKTLI